MPYPNEHSARLREPKDFDDSTFRRKADGTIYGSIKVPATVSVIWGKLKGKAKPSDNPLPQALRFSKSNWTVSEAKKWLKDNNVKYILFEPAAESKSQNMNEDVERRYLSATEIRINKGDNELPVIAGYAAVFNKFSEDLGLWREKIAAGAFAKSIKKDDIRALIDHDSSRILGRNKAGTLSLKEDAQGLFVEITPPDTTIGRDIIVSIERGDISGMSFGFKTITDEWNTEDGTEIRTLKEVKLFDVSPVTFPAYPDTSVGTRSLTKWLSAQGRLTAEERTGKYECECIECGHILKTDKHCKDITCPECGGQMRRKERPGPGRSDAKGLERMRMRLELENVKD